MPTPLQQTVIGLLCLTSISKTYLPTSSSRYKLSVQFKTTDLLIVHTHLLSVLLPLSIKGLSNSVGGAVAPRNAIQAVGPHLLSGEFRPQGGSRKSCSCKLVSKQLIIHPTILLQHYHSSGVVFLATWWIKHQNLLSFSSSFGLHQLYTALQLLNAPLRSPACRWLCLSAVRCWADWF